MKLDVSKEELKSWFSFANAPLSIVVILITWSWLSFLSVIIFG
ncbi:MAG: hypothetical protein ACAH12_04435 [Methylophilaceae bacterium]|nr:hypothetical protein [Methylovorus sp. MM2]